MAKPLYAYVIEALSNIGMDATRAEVNRWLRSNYDQSMTVSSATFTNTKSVMRECLAHLDKSRPRPTSTPTTKAQAVDKFAQAVDFIHSCGGGKKAQSMIEVVERVLV